MQKLFILFLVLACFSCNKNVQEDLGLPLGETKWNLYFKNNSTFSFFAQSQLHFNSNKSVKNYRNFDSLTGTWKSKTDIVTINFDNGDIYNGTAITIDSISGILTASGNNGIWYAIKQ